MSFTSPPSPPRDPVAAYDAALNRIYASADPETFPQHVLPVLLEVTHSQCAAMCANALLPGDPLVAVALPGSNHKVTWRRYNQGAFNDHPTARFTSTPAPARAIRISDHFPTLEAMRAARFYRENLKPIGMEYELTLLLDTPLSQRLGIAVLRARRDYSDAEVDLLSRLGPHLKRAFHHAQTLTQLRAAASTETSRAAAAAWRDIKLTPRESEVLRWAATGRTNREIARLLRVRPATVKTHLEHIFEKLGVKSRAAAAASLRGLPPPPLT